MLENDNFLFDEQVIQDERLLNLETRVLDVENSIEGNQIEITTLFSVTTGWYHKEMEILFPIPLEAPNGGPKKNSLH